MSRKAKAEQIRGLLATESAEIKENTRHFNAERYRAVEEMGPDEMERYRTEARAIKEDAIERIPELIERTREAVEANGGSVYVAEDAADARRHVAELTDEAGRRQRRQVQVDDHRGDRPQRGAFEAADVDVWETDLGEFVVQVADEAPSTSSAPRSTSPARRSRSCSEAHFDPDEPLDSAEKLTDFAREYLGERINDADIGMTGANFVMADSGSIALVTNEGNARKCATVPDTHVAVAGIEKIIPDVADLHPFAEILAARSSTGQAITQYLSILTPPRRHAADRLRRARRTLTSGTARSTATSTSSSSTTGAWRCAPTTSSGRRCTASGAACANSCSYFQSVGGHAFGGETYTGGIATGWEAGVEGLTSPRSSTTSVPAARGV